jgi:short-subunit dehydrogenase
MNLVLLARRKSLLDALAEDIQRKLPVKALCFETDLAMPDYSSGLQGVLSGLDVGIAVYNAAYAPVGDFAGMDRADLLKVVNVNVRGPVLLARTLAPRMIARKRGALVFMSSLAGNQGSPGLAAYAASKAFNSVLAEGLWHELRTAGIDVIVCCAGAVRTPGYAAAAGKDAPGAVDPEFVVKKTLDALGRGPRVIPGFVSQLAHFILGRLLPRRMAIAIMAGSTKKLSGPEKRKAAS